MIDFECFSGYEGLIFDMDGTVIDTMPSHKSAWDKVGETLGYPIDGQMLYELGGASVREIAKVMMQKAAMPMSLFDDVIRLKRQYGIELIMQHSSLLPTFDVVRYFSDKKPLALGTGSHQAIVNLLLTKFDLYSYFDAIVTADDVEKHKPAPDTFLRCAELLHVNPKNCLVFEDADLGIKAGLAAGMDVFDVRINQLVKGK
ncbi:beta-phosphoglucomutase family hydrolase [Avibacterium paragallinarum]|uniref:Beta-phosphoglucomutase family hydrolase n=1 Tax=Avibacterium paragallinarum TaxID=728 RepID=A0AAE5WH15_AVIPA|nr:beta-phosphoglucomutase family hydrolase [Avibacterium paragallinarum]AZI14757.1 beta-phosphoglucomutase family hydrolase [Avibacterium paragallinarum]MEE3607521.1 beta-phosphoglucomutase family hydrolase [Avibacterium paragallinarum]MEE3620103.1 beta-phosphoglucomutase family hydrolase [Avibacterium paragallinarum]MEE3667787.1 beta-phosphoglucomutase family hydrolase [Avibacterium paragallinarum]MEE3680015.1 beta-phosphoglucomutase family hydrolase [Avibacterium paragallinarum]